MAYLIAGKLRHLPASPTAQHMGSSSNDRKPAHPHKARNSPLPAGQMRSCLLDDGKSCQAIAEFLYLDDDTIRGWHKTYQTVAGTPLFDRRVEGWSVRMTSSQARHCALGLRHASVRSTVEIRAHVRG